MPALNPAAMQLRLPATSCVPAMPFVGGLNFTSHPNVTPRLDSTSRCVTQPGGALLGGGSSMHRQQAPQHMHSGSRAIPLRAKRQRRPLDDDVELDDGDGYSGAQGFSIGTFLQQALSALAGATDRLSDIVYDYAPDGISRPTVTLAVRTGLVLVLIGFARSILGFVLTIGTVVLGLFVASRVLGIEAGGRGRSQPRGKRGGKWDSGGSRVKSRPNFDGPPRRLPPGVAKESDVLDVWFETKDVEEERRRR